MKVDFWRERLLRAFSEQDPLLEYTSIPSYIQVTMLLQNLNLLFRHYFLQKISYSVVSVPNQVLYKETFFFTIFC